MRKKYIAKFYFAAATLLLYSIMSNCGIKDVFAVSLKEEARTYRETGYEAQERGDIESAINWYQKAISLDAEYAAPHNDLGILYEAKGRLDMAEAEYQRTLSIDPDYEKAHTNLALLYERKGQLEKAAFHWMRRYKLGKPGDPWTKEAKRRLEKLGLLEKTDKKKLKSSPVTAPESKTKSDKFKKAAVSRKSDASGWTRIGGSRQTTRQPAREADSRQKTAKVTDRRRVVDDDLQESLRLAEERLRKGRDVYVAPSSGEARHYYDRAGVYLKKGEYSRALDEVRTAKREYPGDSSILALEHRIKTKMKEERIEDHYSEGMMHYQKKDYPEARKEFEAILSILPE